MPYEWFRPVAAIRTSLCFVIQKSGRLENPPYGQFTVIGQSGRSARADERRVLYGQQTFVLVWPRAAPSKLFV